MNAPSVVSIEAVVDGDERRVLVTAADQLRECLGAGSGTSWHVQLNFHASLAEVTARAGATVVVASMLTELALGEPLPRVRARWHDDLSSLRGRQLADVFLCTIFRYVAGDKGLRSTRSDANSAPGLTERIRRLNLLAVELSHDTGVGICDIDRVLAHVGARDLQTDYRLGGAAAEVAAYAIVASMLALALGDVVAPDVLERAKNFHGNIWQINQLRRRRLRAPNDAHGRVEYG